MTNGMSVFRPEELQAEIAAAAPALAIRPDRFADKPEIARIPMWLVKEEHICALIDRCVDPAVQPVHQFWLIETSHAHTAAIGQHLADIGFPGHKLAQRLAAEHPRHPPGIDLHLQPDLMRDAVDLPHRFLTPE